METVGKSAIWTFHPGYENAKKSECTKIRKSLPYIVENYIELARRIAELQFRNKDFVLLFRGQSGDHVNKQKNTTLKPSLFRGTRKSNPDKYELERRFNKLKYAEDILAEKFHTEKRFGYGKILRQRILRWSILQHYEICPTPLLDVTHSLRIACSFASDHDGEEGYIFVLGVPNISGAVTASAEAGLQIIRLSSVCPPSAVRPHIQEGYLLGEYPDMVDFDQKKYYLHYEIDFGRRLIAKFKFNKETFWTDENFPKIERSALYPNESDELVKLTDQIKSTVQNSF